MKDEYNKIKEKLSKKLSVKRFDHTIGVSYTAAAMAMRYGLNVHRSAMSRLLHDCAKCLSTAEKIRLCEDHHILMTAVELENPGLLHAKAGMALAEEQYGVTDPDILHAIKVHTTGEPDMSILDKIIYIADYIEPMRKEAPHLEEIREIAFHDLNQGVAEILYDTLHYLNNRKGSIDPATQLTYEFYKQFGKEQPWKH